MCLTIPKKVISKDGDFFVLENPKGNRQKAKSIVDLKIGDYCLTQNGFIIQKISQKEYKQAIDYINSIRKEA